MYNSQICTIILQFVIKIHPYIFQIKSRLYTINLNNKKKKNSKQKQLYYNNG